MSSRDEIVGNAPVEDQQSLHTKEAELDTLRQELATLKVAVHTAEQQVKEEEARAKTAEAKVATAEKKAQEATRLLEDDGARKRFLQEEKKARRRLRDFVQQSLSDILMGVDGAAVHARHRELDEGLKDSGFITPSRIGSNAASGRESVVEFDLAVVAGTQVTDRQSAGKERGVRARVSFMEVIPLGFSAEARASVRTEKNREERSDVSHHNRVRFTVPVTFASLDEPVE